ncbi:unnamed protein product [Thlaspi arvense]|uniref:Cytochrome P450 n=1 Tax=Thlaspi arvense TaxID=13288 RepID=A0AAU9SZZ6_THLAR|nr:unnamed protein product [Thlaspi arvense]
MKSLRRPKNKKRMAPMVPGGWPLIGHLRAFDNGKQSNHTFGDMADVTEHSRAGEVDVAFGELYRQWEQKGGSQKGVLVDMSQEFHDLIKNFSLMMIAGKRYYGASPNCEIGEAMRCGKLFRDFVDYFGLYLLSDLVPPLGWLEWRTKRDMKRTASALDELLEAWIEEHKKKRKDSVSGGNLLDLLLEVFEQQDNPSLDDGGHKTIKSLCLNLVLSGTQATIVTLVWAVSLLANNPDVLKKAQEELQRTIGESRAVEESDLKDLVYLQAIVKETLRLYPPATLTPYRVVMEDFDIANETFMFLQRDPNLWSNPEAFERERFLTSDREVDVGGQSYKLTPFGLGRMACPGIPLGMTMVQYLLARFLHSFDLATPSGQDVDMIENNGFANYKATPLELFITPRLHKSLYQNGSHRAC